MKRPTCSKSRIRNFLLRVHYLSGYHYGENIPLTKKDILPLCVIFAIVVGFIATGLWLLE